MSNRWPGGLIRKTPVTPAGPLQNGAAPGMWTLAEASFWTKQGLWPIAGNFLAVEDVFSTYLYTGNGSTQTITNGINLSGQGGLVWAKGRINGNSHILTDTARGVANTLATNFNGAQNALETNALNSFNSNGFTLNNSIRINASGEPTVSWTFRKAPNFFDVVTYTGDGVSGREIAHNLGSVPGMVIVKRTDSAANWVVWQRSLSDPSKYLVLNLTDATATDSFGPWGPSGGGYPTNASAFTDTFFRVANDVRSNAGGGAYVAYVFAHNTASDGLIQCGSFNNSGGLATVTLGWEPQWILMKNAAAAGDWFMVDNMRGLVVGGSDPYLYANSPAAENSGDIVTPTATGFVTAGLPGSTNFIYVAIRRGPMRTPTLGTSVFAPVYATSASSPYTVTTNFPVDSVISAGTSSGFGRNVNDRLRGGTTTYYNTLFTSSTGAESINSGANGLGFQSNTSIIDNGYWAGYGLNVIYWNFRRAPGFMDVVCFTATSGLLNISHNLGVAPELVIVKTRGTTGNWLTLYSAGAGMVFYLDLDWRANNGFNPVDNFTSNGSTYTAPTATSLFFNNLTSATQVAYLFASAPGVSKVGSYTGNGSSQTINCAFTTGARFVLIKRTDSTGDWYVWDSARGIVAGNDPYLALNSTAAEVTTNDSVDTDSTGFVVNQVAASNINVNAATYIFLAIA